MRTLQVSTPAREPLPFVLPLAHGIGHRAGFASYRGGPLVGSSRLKEAEMLRPPPGVLTIHAQQPGL
jgi:hypothetical protein